MSFRDIDDPKAIHAAMAEFDRLGQAGFLEKYGFHKAREYLLRDGASGRLYDSKAIVGAAHGYAFPERGPLTPKDFCGGRTTVAALLDGLGFEVVRVRGGRGATR